MEPLFDNILEFEVSGPLALFTNPITMTSGELSSYQVPTYSALQGIADNIYWKPTIMWNPLEVRIMNRICMEPKSKLLPKYLTSGTDRAYNVYLDDVRYQVRVEMLWSNDEAYAKDRNVKKHMDSANRWTKRGGKSSVYLGKADCIADVKPCKFGEGVSYYDNIDISFGLMLHGQTWPNAGYDEVTKTHIVTRMFYCEMTNGIITFPAPKDCPVQRVIREENPVWVPAKY